MGARMARALGPLVVVATLLVAACDDSGPPSPLPATPDTNQKVTLSATVYLLAADEMRGYDRVQSSAVSPTSIANDFGDSTIAAKITAQGLGDGAKYEYSPPHGQESSTPFLDVVSQGLVFATPTGAAAFVTDEQARQRSAASAGGTVSALTGVAHVNADDVAGLAEAGSAGSGAPPQAYLVIARRGRVVVELFGAGETASATRAQFDRLLALQEAKLATGADA